MNNLSYLLTELKKIYDANPEVHNYQIRSRCECNYTEINSGEWLHGDIESIDVAPAEKTIYITSRS